MKFDFNIWWRLWVALAIGAIIIPIVNKPEITLEGVLSNLFIVMVITCLALRRSK